jgi:hypothetical protein
MTIMPTNKLVLTEEQISWLKENFCCTRNAKLAEHLGISERSVARLASRYGLKKSDEHMKQMYQDLIEASIKAMKGVPKPPGFRCDHLEPYRFKPGHKRVPKSPEAEMLRRERQVASRAATLKLEKARALFGLPRQTKMPVVQKPRWQIQMRYRLKKLGYIFTERGSTTAFYNENTNRSLIMENRPRSGFYFVDITNQN